MGVNVLIIYRVIFMVAGRGEDRREIEGIDAQILQVIQVLDNPPQVAAEKFDPARLAKWTRYLAPGPRDDRLTITCILAITDIVGGIAIGKALGKNLVKDAVAHPQGRMVVSKYTEIRRVRRRIPHHPSGSKPPVALVCQKKKAVVVSHHPDLDIPLPPARGRILRDQPQRSHMLLAIRDSANENAFNRCIQASTHAELYS